MTRTRLLLLVAALLALVSSAAIGVPILAGQPYGGGCTAITNVALSTTSETVFAAEGGRKEACITNNDASIAIHVARHATATTADPRVAAGQAYCIGINGGYQYEGVIDAIAASGTPAISGESCK